MEETLPGAGQSFQKGTPQTKHHLWHSKCNTLFWFPNISFHHTMTLTLRCLEHQILLLLRTPFLLNKQKLKRIKFHSRAEGTDVCKVCPEYWNLFRHSTKWIFKRAALPNEPLYYNFEEKLEKQCQGQKSITIYIVLQFTLFFWFLTSILYIQLKQTRYNDQRANKNKILHHN